MPSKNEIVAACAAVFADLDHLPDDERIDAINAIKLALREHSPLKDEPVDCVLWVPAEQVHANDYNPNAVAPPEMELLNRSIVEDGYTQPIVTWPTDAGRFEVVDGFHRNRVGKENKRVRLRTRDRLPVTVIRASQADRPNRMASTIRHNRARGTHAIDLMVGIVGDLVQAGMSDDWISRHLGMDADELLRLKQISGIAALFRDRDFSRAWAANAQDEAFYDRA